MLPTRIYLIAGEASGDFLGAQLMRALRSQQPDIQFYGVGGALMEAEGLSSLFPMEDLSVMGLGEVLPRLPLLIKRIKQTTNDIIEREPYMVVSIDAPDFSFRVQRKIANYYAVDPMARPRQIHYVAPTVWAWRPKRAKKLRLF